MIVPSPSQRGQVRCMVKKPCWVRTTPVPAHIVHVCGEVPGLQRRPSQVSQVIVGGDLDVALAPLGDLLEGDLELELKSAPRARVHCGRRRRPPPPKPPPKTELSTSKRSPKPPAPPPNPPGPPAPPKGLPLVEPNRS